jgi:mRNA interferase RelE/StbE
MNKWRIIIAPVVRKKVGKLPQKEQEKIGRYIKRLVEDYRSVDFKYLEGRTRWRLKVGGWRIIFEVDFFRNELKAVDFGSRGDIYKK